jgi:hypothetical protein
MASGTSAEQQKSQYPATISHRQSKGTMLSRPGQYPIKRTLKGIEAHFENAPRYRNLGSFLFSRVYDVGAGEGNRTLVCSLGSCRSAIELRPQNQ